jgi:hypothetical protein
MNLRAHTVTHPRLAVLDEVNMIYELEKSKEEIRNKLGERVYISRKVLMELKMKER